MSKISTRQRRPIISGIYSIRNKINGKVYVGSSKDIYTRWSQHRHDLRKGNHHNEVLQRAWNKYGERNFAFEVLEKAPPENLFNVEQNWYERLNSSSNDYGYNLSPIARAPGHCYTREDIKNGKACFSIEQFDKIVDLLCSSDLSIPQISAYVGVGERTIYQMYFKEQYASLTKNFCFKKRKNRSSCKLSEEDLPCIVQRLKNRETLLSIAKDYNVGLETISDIKRHNTWKEYTKGIIFEDSINRKTNSKPVVQYDKQMNFLGEFPSARAAEKATGVGYRLISQVCSGDKKSAHGFIFRYASSV